MIIKNETRLYAILSLIGIILILMINILPLQGSFKQSVINPASRISLGKTVTFTSSNIFIITLCSLFYLALLVSGIINLFVFIYKTARKKPFLTLKPVPQGPSLSNKDTSMLIFGVIYAYLAVNLISLAVARRGDISYSLSIFIALSLIFYSFIIISVLKIIPFKRLGTKLSRNEAISLLKIYSITVIAIIAVILMLGQAQKIFHVPFNPQPIVYIVAILKEKWLLTVLILEISILAPLGEELLFRGIIYNYLRERVRWEYAAVLTSLLFAIMHENLFGFFIIFVLSMAICYLYEKSRNITVAFLFHSLYNTLNIINILVFRHLFLN